MRQPNRIRTRKDTITCSKLLIESEQAKLISYLEINQKATGGIRERLICDLLLHTGLRAKELCQLRLQDTPTVLGVNAIEVYRGKEDKDRTVPVSGRLAHLIEFYIKQLRGLTMPRRIKRSDIDKPLFYSQSQRPYTPNTLYVMIRRTGLRAGIRKRLHPHMFRHTFAVNSLRNGVDIYLLQYLMGHSDIKTTSMYLHIVKEHIKDLGDKLDVPV